MKGRLAFIIVVMNPRKEYGKMKWSNHGTCAAPNGCPVKNLEKGQGESWRQLQLCNPSDEQWKNVAEKQGAEDVIAVGKCMQHRSLVNPLSELDTYPTMMGKLQSRLHHPARRIEDLGRDASITLGFVDGQRFKKINDEYNHQAGNDVIRDIARVLKELI